MGLNGEVKEVQSVFQWNRTFDEVQVYVILRNGPKMDIIRHVLFLS